MVKIYVFLILIVMVKLYSKLKDKIRRNLYNSILSKYGYGNRISKNTWNKQFSLGVWDYLYSKDEEAHYQQIIEFKNRYKPNGKILDVGCGQGVLFAYLKQKSESIDYFGIDISETAVKLAIQTFPGGNFKKLDFEYKGVEGKYDVIIFNESLYYFNKPLKKIEHCIKHNLVAGGYIIISMCDFTGHNIIWEKLKKKYTFLSLKELKNSKQQIWTVGVFEPEQI